MILFALYMAFSLVAMGVYLAKVGFNGDELFVLTMERVEAERFALQFLMMVVIMFVNIVYLL
jgi:hypothetical protein